MDFFQLPKCTVFSHRTLCVLYPELECLSYISLQLVNSCLNFRSQLKHLFLAKASYLYTYTCIHGKSHERSLVGCSPWGHEELDTTERLHFHFSLFTFMHWRRKWQPTPVFLPGESQGWRSLMGCRLWGRTESDNT